MQQGDPPADGADEIEVDNEAPRYSLLVERSGCMQELKFCSKSKR